VTDVGDIYHLSYKQSATLATLQMLHFF